MIYFFDIEKCRYCLYRDGCFKEGSKKKTYGETLKSDAHSRQGFRKQNNSKKK